VFFLEHIDPVVSVRKQEHHFDENAFAA